MPIESRPNRKKRKSQGIRAEGTAIRTLRTLNNEEAFHFYEAIDKPTGLNARNLQEFLDKIKTVKLESLVFHLERNDFKNWIANTLDDPKLAEEIEMIPKGHNEQLRTRIHTTVRARLKELEGISVQIDEPIRVSH
jgi:hypothetical protein